jgi:hypothetical protein
LRDERRIQEAVRSALVTPSFKGPYEEDVPQYTTTPGPGSTRFSTIDSASNVQIYPRAQSTH